MLLLLAMAAAAAAEPAAAPQPPEESVEEIAQDAARDLKDSRFYNKPGATRAAYNADWQECRLIARGTRTPTGTYVYTYNPAIISPAVAGAAAGAGSFIGQLIAEGQLRRANRRECLMIKGWRWVEVDDATKQRVAAMSDAERDAYFETIVGASELPASFEVRSWINSFAAPKLAPESEQ